MRDILGDMLRLIARTVAIVFCVLALAAVGYWQYVERIGNTRVAKELVENPNGERAARVLLLDLPSGRQIPVNYIYEVHEQEMVFVAADGGWWSEFVEPNQTVTVLLRGQSRSGRASAILDDPERTKEIFARLRPDALEGFGTLIEIRLERRRESAP